MPKQTLRLDEVRAPTQQDDSIPNATLKSTVNNLTDYQQFNNALISRLRDFFGSDSWLDDAPPSVNSSTGPVQFVDNSLLVGVQNGVNIVFTCNTTFLPGTQKVFYNGQKLMPGASYDYTISESGGVGTGYDTITMVGHADMPPRASDLLEMSYQRPL